MTPRSRRRLCLALAIVSGLGLPLAALAVVLLLNPYALLLAGTFSVRNTLPETIMVTPLAGVRMASGEHVWKVLPRLAVRFLAAPAYPQARIPIPPGEARRLHANFDDASLGVLAVATASEPGRAMLVDRAAAAGGCCYPPRNPEIVVRAEALVHVERRMLEAVDEADRGTARRLVLWYSIVGSGGVVLLVFLVSVRKYRSLRGADAGS
jgi:hypothetical protein